MYAKKHPNLPVAYECFRKIFKFNFNLGFGSPKTDACSFCETVRNQIKAEKNTERKKSLMTDLVVHKKNSFYDLLKEQSESLKTICFDHQQNQVLPKDPDQQAYYSQQLYTYNFCVVENNRSGSLNKDNVHIYPALCFTSPAIQTWMVLASDACDGQNKNSALIYMAG